jgi:mRNA-degrading endonuclease RelE of RelBE toxin-antitoxin system
VTLQVFLSEKAQDDLDELPAKIAAQIAADCSRLASNPVPDGKRIKKLQGYKENLYRLRAGDYRIVFRRSGTRVDIVQILSKPDFQRLY